MNVAETVVAAGQVESIHTLSVYEPAFKSDVEKPIEAVPLVIFCTRYICS